MWREWGEDINGLVAACDQPVYIFSLSPLKVGLASLNERQDTLFYILALHNGLQVRQKLFCCSLFTLANG